MLEQVECLCTGYGLRTALHPQFATDVRDMFLDGAQTQNQATSDLPIGRSGSEQPQHLALARGERRKPRTECLDERCSSSLGPCAKGSEQRSDIVRQHTTRLDLPQQGEHRGALVHEQAKVSLWDSQAKSTLEGGERTGSVASCGKR